MSNSKIPNQSKKSNPNKGNLIIVKTDLQDQYYKTINLTSLLDKKLSFKAKGLHNYIMTRPDNWQLWSEALFSTSTDRETSVRSAINELIENNYLYRTTIRDKKKKIKAWVYIAFSIPTKVNEQLLKKLNLGNLKIDNQDLENQGLSNKIYSKKNNSSNIINNITDKNIYTLFLEKWNENKITIHKKITSKREAAINKILKLKDYTQEEIFKAFQNYAFVLHSPDYFFKYPWTMEDFLQRGLHEFVDEAIPLTAFKKFSSSDNQSEPLSQTKLSSTGFPIISKSYDRKSKFRKTVEEWQTLLETNTNKLLNADIWKTNHTPNKITVFNNVVSMQVWLDNVDFSLYGGSNLQNRIKPLYKLIDYYILCISEWWDWMDGVKDNVFDVDNKIFKMFIREMEDSFPARIEIKSNGWVNDSDWEPRD